MGSLERHSGASLKWPVRTTYSRATWVLLLRALPRRCSGPRRMTSSFASAHAEGET
jgi:hypothetical protein